MTVRELIKELEELPNEAKDTPVCHHDADEGRVEVENVYYGTYQDGSTWVTMS